MLSTIFNSMPRILLWHEQMTCRLECRGHLFDIRLSSSESGNIEKRASHPARTCLLL